MGTPWPEIHPEGGADIMMDPETELIVANETILEAKEVFVRLRMEYQALWEHTDALEAILKEHGIAFPEFGGW